MFAGSEDPRQAYANWRNKQTLINNYAFTDPNAIALLNGLCQASRDYLNPPGFLAERAQEIITGREAFTGRETGRVTPAAELLAAWAIGKLTGIAVDRAMEPEPFDVRVPSRTRTTSPKAVEGAEPVDVRSGPKQASGEISFKRWKRGEAIDKPLPDGSAPSWEVVQSRYWKNRYEATKNSGEFSAANLEKMRRGNAPVDYNPRTQQFEPRELHHVTGQQYRGPNDPLNIRELTPDWHAEVDPFRIRPGVKTTRGIR